MWPMYVPAVPIRCNASDTPFPCGVTRTLPLTPESPCAVSCASIGVASGLPTPAVVSPVAASSPAVQAIATASAAASVEIERRIGLLRNCVNGNAGRAAAGTLPASRDAGNPASGRAAHQTGAGDP